MKLIKLSNLKFKSKLRISTFYVLYLSTIPRSLNISVVFLFKTGRISVGWEFYNSL